MEKFTCQQTGMCCSHIRGFASESSMNWLKEYAYGKLPIVSIIPVEKASFPLWDFEAKRFKRLAEEKGIKNTLVQYRINYINNILIPCISRHKPLVLPSHNWSLAFL